MTYSRRRLLAAGATGTLALTAGCLDFVRGTGPLELEAKRVAPTDEALAETGYGEREITDRSLEETIDVGVERDVRATVWTSVYAKEIEYQGHTHEGSVFAAVSIPDFSVLGYSANPIANMNNEQLLEEFLSELESDRSIENVTHQESFDLEILSEEREVDVFEGESELEGEPIDVEIVLSSFSHNDDIIVLLGSYPAPLAEESANTEVLMESVEHPV
ncbi:DUF6517 family protein [Natronorubrum aibiense]|uniref:Uncharacterized protein n=1 Tax=Natronorubrum aibiense TaxID=348826 RepID=A0A5P9P6E2_9EURY|nr:DUF6517 family protein [Natronorubrum aibiense]QFU83656.1 hypothetical protein GCU68_14445 [Natronorubrum aibiense]